MNYTGLIVFAKVLAWISALTSMALLVSTFHDAVKYEGSYQQQLDRILGKKRKFFIGRWAIVALVSWAVVIALWGV